MAARNWYRMRKPKGSVEITPEGERVLEPYGAPAPPTVQPTTSLPAGWRLVLDNPNLPPMSASRTDPSVSLLPPLGWNYVDELRVLGTYLPTDLVRSLQNLMSAAVRVDHFPPNHNFPYQKAIRTPAIALPTPP